ncbi:MAG: NAD(P)-dependent oxidoreductase [Gammaproteobacteria bacterium]|nr:NAD(P)-dependent oxidoreductase [Gammaproteobacteria bacterium]
MQCRNARNRAGLKRSIAAVAGRRRSRTARAVESVPDVKPRRLSDAEIAENFSDMHPPLSRAEALIEADRCYFCYDAPCTEACPTDIDIPGFIQKIRSDNINGAAHTILRENIMGGMCARVCPTEILCEEACVRMTHEEKPVRIGLLQRHATDPVFEEDVQLFTRGRETGKNVAVVGSGPAGLSCAHRLSMLGHNVVILNRDDKPGGLNEYGIAAYKTVNDFAQREAEWILSIGGIELRSGVALGDDFSLEQLREEYDAVFLAFGLGGTNRLNVANEDIDGVLNAVDYISQLRQADDKGDLPVGRNVVVIGGGMTAIDIAVQTKRLGSERVDIVYRRGPEQMGASQYEQEFAQTSGVHIQHWSQPKRLLVEDRVSGVEFERTTIDADGTLRSTGETWSLNADIVFKAVGQTANTHILGKLAKELRQQNGKLVVDDNRMTTLPDIWAGGDCIYGHDDLTVTAVQDGKIAAKAIDRYLAAGD